LGDSEVFGYIVPKEKTFTFLLEERFKKEGKNYFLKINDNLRFFAIKNQMLFIDPPINDFRARNDPHSNEASNYAKAEGLYQFLMLNFDYQISLK
tara:strand:- start:246 stop:530 length:285 start_codon:yes stop_codon:yes gene_type:complete